MFNLKIPGQLNWVVLGFATIIVACSSNDATVNNQRTDPCESYIPGTSDKEDFLCAHNAVRAAPTPPANPALQAMTWNDDLATVAQAWAETCTFEHNANRSDQYNALSGENITVGENLYVSTNPSVKPDDAVNAWADEAQFYDYATDNCATGEVCGHYTQIVWRSSLQVGCGLNFCATVAGIGLTDATLMVCEYAPAGNVIGQKPY